MCCLLCAEVIVATFAYFSYEVAIAAVNFA